MLVPGSYDLANFPVDFRPYDLTSFAGGQAWIPFFDAVAGGGWAGYDNTYQQSYQRSGDAFLKILQLTGVNSPTRKYCLDMEVKGILGKGLRALNETQDLELQAWIKAKNANKQTFAHELDAITADWMQFGNAYILVNRVVTQGKNAIQLLHLPTFNSRLKRPANAGDDVDTVMYSPNFMTLAGPRNAPPNMTEYPIWGKGEKEVTYMVGEDTYTCYQSVIHMRKYRAGYEFYGLPAASDFMPAWIESGTLGFYDDLVSNGCFPSGLLQIVDSMMPAEERTRYEDRFTKAYSGKGKHGKIIARIIASKEASAEFTQIKPEIDEGFFDIEEKIEAKIIRTHGLTGFHDASSKGVLSSTKDQIADAWEMYYNTMLLPECTLLAQTIADAIRPQFGEIELEFIPSPPVQRNVPMTINEVREKNGLPPLSSEIGNQLWKS